MNAHTQQRVFSYPQIVTGFLLGTPLAGAALVAANAYTLRRISYAWLTLALTVGYIAIVAFAPSMGYALGTVLYIATSIAILFINQLTIGSEIYQRKSWAASLLITASGLLLYVTMAVLLS